MMNHSGLQLKYGAHIITHNQPSSIHLFIFVLQVPFNGGFQNAKENVDDSTICTANLSRSSQIRVL